MSKPTSEARDTEPRDTTPRDSESRAAGTRDSQASGAPTSALDRYFKITERGSTVGTEIRGGFVTFFAMAYIVVLNPLIVGTVADRNGYTLGIAQVAAATALAAGVMTLLFGLIARYPFGIAAGLGINTLVAVTMVATEGLTWPEAMGLVVLDGIIIVLLAVSGFRTAVFHAIPHSLIAAMGVGIGLFIAMVGFVDAGFVRRIPDAAMTTVPVQLGINGSIGSWPTLVFVVGLIVSGYMIIRNVRGGLFIAIVLNTIFAMIVEAIAGAGSAADSPTGWSLAVPVLPDALGGMPDLSIVGDISLFGAFSRVGVLAATLLLLTLVLANFFDAMGAMTALGKQANLVDEQGVLPDMKRALIVEGTGAIVGGGASASSNTVFMESATGIADGARTGLANVVTGSLFLLAMFLTPLYEIVPIEAAAPVLVVVGALMMAQAREIDFNDFSVGFPAFLTIAVMPFTYSIANGIGVGFIAYTLMSIFAGRIKDIHWIMWLLSALFVVYFAADPILNAIH